MMWVRVVAQFDSRRLHYFSKIRSASCGSSNRIAASTAAGLRCMYRSVVPRSSCPASSWIARAGAPRIASWEQNVCRRMCPPGLPLGNFARPRALDNEPHLDAKSRQHVDQGIGAEQIDASSQQVTDSRLRDSKQFGDVSLLE